MQRRDMVTTMIVIVCLTCSGEGSGHLCSGPADKCDPRVVQKIVETMKKFEASKRQFVGQETPKGVNRDMWRLELYQSMWKCLFEVGNLFEIHEHCPEAMVEIILAAGGTPDYLNPHDPFSQWFDFFETISYLRLLYLQVLDSGEDARLKELLPKLRDEFVPAIQSSGDRQFLERYKDANKRVPQWYVERAFASTSQSDVTREPPLLKHESPYEGLSRIAYELFLHEQDTEFVRDNYTEVEWSFHIIDTYGLRCKYNRARPRDRELAKKQLKWLWDTKKWWARRYVVEVMDRSPELAFETIVEELQREQDPYVAPRIARLKLVERLAQQNKQ